MSTATMSTRRIPRALAAGAAGAWLLLAVGGTPAGELPAPARDSDFYEDGEPPAAQVRLGQLLFFDKLLSGNRNISCASCHHPLAATGDGLAVSIGEGAKGLGVTRDTGAFPDEVGERIGRNAQPLFNLGAREFTRMFHDGRAELEAREQSRILTPAGDELPPGLDNVLAAQAMLPVVSLDEMAGQYGENEVATAVVLGDLTGAWERLSARLRDPENGYTDLFAAAFPDRISAPGDIDYVHAANALGAFQAVAWRADDSPFDRYLRGDRSALSESARRGMALFYGRAGCDGCHAGTFQTDHDFHAIAMPQIGPGKGNGFDGHEDFGRQRVTGDPDDRYRFRTPSLRNVALTGPWGHDGAYDSLREVVRHHLDPVAALTAYEPERPLRPSRPDLDARDFLAHDDVARRAAIAARNELAPVTVSEDELSDLVEFLHALTDPASLDLGRHVPERVPSDLPVRD